MNDNTTTSSSNNSCVGYVSVPPKLVCSSSLLQKVCKMWHREEGRPAKMEKKLSSCSSYVVVCVKAVDWMPMDVRFYVNGRSRCYLVPLLAPHKKQILRTLVDTHRHEKEVRDLSLVDVRRMNHFHL